MILCINYINIMVLTINFLNIVVNYFDLINFSVGEWLLNPLIYLCQKGHQHQHFALDLLYKDTMIIQMLYY